MGRPPFSRRLDVWMNGELVGHWTRQGAGRSSFTYAESWLIRDGAFAASLMLPLRSGEQTGEHVGAVFENLLPDVERTRRLIAEHAEASSISPHDLLSAIGRESIGAMHFVPHGTEPGDPFAIESIVQTEAEIAATIRDLECTPLGIKADDPFRITLAGAQDKTGYLWRDGAWHRSLGCTPSTHLFKRRIGRLNDGVDMTDSIENEYICLKLAASFGLPVNEAKIQRFEDQDVLVITRFDRKERSVGGFVRLPQEDFLQAMGYFSGNKYQNDGGPGMGTCLDLLAGSIAASHDMETFLSAQIFFWMIGATDGHAKNYSIFLGPRGFVMTPLYDILSSAPAPVRNNLRNRQLRLSMFVGKNRHYRLDEIMPRHFEQTAAAARVPQEVRRRAFDRLVGAGAEAFDSVLAGLPQGFPERVALPIIEYGKLRMRYLQDYVAQG